VGVNSNVAIPEESIGEVPITVPAQALVFETDRVILPVVVEPPTVPIIVISSVTGVFTVEKGESFEVKVRVDPLS
jgi:hypothetical protein